MEIQRPLRPCKKTGCTALVREGAWCDKHKPQDSKQGWSDHGKSKAWRKGYATAWWRRARGEQLIIQPFCVDCDKRGIRTKATEVDHITPHRGDMTAFYDKTNLQSLCHKCHSAKTIREQNNDRRREVRGADTPPTLKKF